MHEFIGTYIQGHGVASGQSLPANVEGSLARQIKAIKRLDHPQASSIDQIFETCFIGTINLAVADIPPAPDWLLKFSHIEWFPNANPEDLYFHPVTLILNGQEYSAYCYQAGDNYHGASKIEIIAPWIEGLKLNQTKLKIRY